MQNASDQARRPLFYILMHVSLNDNVRYLSIVVHHRRDGRVLGRLKHDVLRFRCERGRRANAHSQDQPRES